jgi:hypothetical protein
VGSCIHLRHWLLDPTLATIAPPQMTNRDCAIQQFSVDCGHQPANMTPNSIDPIDLEGKLQKIASGKVRELYAIDDDTLLFVASDRISAYDVVMENVSPRISQQPNVLYSMNTNTP